MTTQTTTKENQEKWNKINSYIDEFSKDPDIIEVVKRIESGIKTTQGNYGEYLQFLTPYAKSKTTLYIISRTCIKTGADDYGVSWAVKILTGGC